jgi:ABC-2 type transport system ATP-binding protein
MEGGQVCGVFFLDPFDTQGQKINASVFRRWLKPLARFFLTKRESSIQCPIMIEVENLTKSFNKFMAVDDVSFEVGKGEVVGFLGPNGAGKTTTLRMIAGYFPPTRGRCMVGGHDIQEAAIEAKRQIGYLPENNPVYSEMKVMEYLEFLGALRDVPNLPSRISDVAESCKIRDVMSRNMGELSKGYRQRVGLAQAILHEPDILIMDEPTEGLDPNQVAQVRELIKELGKQKTVVISTHRLEEVEATCERILIINRGKIVADAKKDELHRLAEGKEVVSLQIKGPEENVSKLIGQELGITNVQTKSDGKITSLEIEAENDLREKIFDLCVSNNWKIIDMHRRVVSLENIFRELTSQEAKDESRGTKEEEKSKNEGRKTKVEDKSKDEGQKTRGNHE